MTTVMNNSAYLLLQHILSVLILASLTSLQPLETFCLLLELAVVGALLVDEAQDRRCVYLELRSWAHGVVSGTEQLEIIIHYPNFSRGAGSYIKH